MKKTISILLPLLFLLSCQSGQKTPDSNDETAPTAVKVIGVAATSISDSLHVTGLLTTENEEKLSFKINGVIDRIDVNEGDFVRRGQLLATIKPTEINVQVDQSNLALEKAQRDFTRASNLYRDSVGTLEQLQNARTNLDLAQKAVEATRFNRDYSFIKAAADGFITKKMASEGEVMAAGAPVLSLDETNGNKDFILRVGVTDAEWAAVALGRPAIASLDAYKGKTFRGFVFRKARTADAASGAFQLDIAIRFNDEKPAAGMFGKATLVPGQATTQFVIPYEALIQVEGNKAAVLMPAAAHSLKKVAVTIRSFNDKDVIVESGLTSGDQVVISNNAFLNERSKIDIVK